MNEPIDHIYCCQNFTCCPDANSSVYQISQTDKHTQNISVIIGNGFTKTIFVIDGGSKHNQDRNLITHPYHDNVTLLMFKTFLNESVGHAI